MRNFSAFATPVVLALLLASCGQKAVETASATGNTMGNSTDVSDGAFANAAGDETLAPAPTGQEFADKAAKSDAFEIAAAKLAKEKASSAELKSFAAMMMADHTASTAKIKAAAAKADPAIKPDPTLTADQNQKLADLGKLSGADFDKEYATQQVGAHEEALSLMTLYSDKGDVASLKSAAGEIKPKVQTHLDRIKAIRDKLTG